MHPVNEFMGFDIIICHHNRYKSRLKFLKNDTKAVEFYDIVWLFFPPKTPNGYFSSSGHIPQSYVDIPVIYTVRKRLIGL